MENISINNLNKITHEGNCEYLEPMPNGKNSFPMAYCHKWKTLITVGGFNNKLNDCFKETTAY